MQANNGNLSALAAWFQSFFSSQGFRGANLKAAEAGAIGNLEVESGLNPAAYNPGEGAHNVAQWERGRWTAMQAVDARAGVSTSSVAGAEAQLRAELTGPYSGVVANLRGVTDPRQAAQIWQSQYEGSTVASLPARQDAASAVYSWLGGAGSGFASFAPSMTGGGDSGGGSSSSTSGPALPYPLGVSGNLTAAQRTGMIGYLEAVGNAPAAIVQWLASNVGGVGNVQMGFNKTDPAKALSKYEASGGHGNQYDQYLEAAYNAIGAGGGIGYGAGHLSYQWHMPGSGVLGNVVGAVENALTWAAKPVVKWLLAAFLVIVGVMFVWLAVRMLGDTDSATPAFQPSSSTRTDDEEAETPKSEAPAGELEGGEVAAAAA